MFFNKIKQTVSEFARMREVSRIFFELIIDVVISNLRKPKVRTGEPSKRREVLVWILMLVFRRKEAEEVPFPVKLRLTLERLGPTYVKLGQILSMRRDFLPEEITEELSKLQNQVPPFPFAIVKKIIESEFRKPLNELFAHFEEKPLAAASLAQTHVAYLPDGTKVVVKVQRPGIVKVITNDIQIMRRLASILERFLPWIRKYQPRNFVEEFAEYTFRELDFRNEGKHADIFRKNFEGHPYVSFPKVYWDYTSEKVLTLEFIEGVKANEIEKIDEWGIDRKKLVKIGVEAVLKMLYEDGFFHGDPHPGNVFVTKEGKIVLIDLGMIGKFNEEIKRLMFYYFFYMVIQEFEIATKYLFLTTHVTPETDEEGFRQELARLLESWSGSKFSEFSLAQLTLETMLIGGRHNVLFHRDMVLMTKSLVTIEAIGTMWDPEMDLSEVARPWLEKKFIEYVHPKQLYRSFLNALPDYIEFIKGLPQYSLEILKKIEEGKLDVEFKNMNDLKKQIDDSTNRRNLSILSAASIIAGALMMNVDFLGYLFDIIPLPSAIAFGVGAFLFLYQWFKKK